MKNQIPKFLLLLLLKSVVTNAQKVTSEDYIKIIIGREVESLSPAGAENTYYDKSFTVTVFPIGLTSLYPEHFEIAGTVNQKKLKWSIPSNTPVLLISRFLGKAQLASPGDSVIITYENSQKVFSGPGHEKYKLQYEIELLKQQLTYPGKKANLLTINSIPEYLQQSKYCDLQTEAIVRLIDSYKTKITIQEYNWIKTHAVELIESERVIAFIGFSQGFSYEGPGDKYPFTANDLNTIWDTTQYKPWAKWLRAQSNYHNGESPLYFYSFNRYEVWRKYGFNYNDDSLGSKPIRTYMYFTNASKNFKGLLRERTMAYILDEQTLTEMGPFHPMTITLLKNYYTQPGFENYKRLVKSLEEKAMQLRPNKPAPDFQLVNEKEKQFTKNDLKGKIALIDFWFTGCTGCLKMVPELKKIEEEFKNDSNIVFVSISTDKDKQQWQASLKQAKYTTGSAINLYTGGQGARHSIIKEYNITGYPELYLLDMEGKIIANPVPDPRTETGGKELTGLLKKESAKASVKKHALQHDGPYILYNNELATAYSITNSKIIKQEVTHKAPNKITVSTDKAGINFTVTLKATLQPEPSEYEKSSRLLALSDIEGNFEALRLLLQANKVIDENFNWIFGNGHLVFAGDMFDRGLQVTECLWLIYSLEEKAKAAGGYVHFILGNHEVMNLQGNHSYTQMKYKNNAVLLNKSLVELYSTNSELGKWLRTKNIIEKIGDLLFVHGGISPDVNNLSLTVPDINNISRPFYGGNIDSSNHNALVLFNDKRNNGKDKTSPFWFRGYYGDLDNAGQIPSMEQVDNTLKKFNVRHIITGHTIVADTISLWYKGKVINIDTHHMSGKSEALMAEEDNYYRVNAEGNRVLLFVDDKKQKQFN